MGSYFDKPFVPDAAQAQASYEPIPDDSYKLLIEKAEETKSKANNAMIKMQLTVESGQKTGDTYAGRKLFANINLEHEKPIVVEIGAKQLHALVLMTGLKQLNDATELAGCVIVAHVKVVKRKDTGEMDNEVVFAHKKGDEPAAQPTGTPAPSTSPKAAPSANW